MRQTRRNPPSAADISHSLRNGATDTTNRTMRARLTVLIPCKNEQSNIRDCILSARRVADEVLVADSGSQDETLNIVEDVGGCRLIQRQFITYADFKNWAIPQAAHPWVLVVDADERVSGELATEIVNLLA